MELHVEAVRRVRRRRQHHSLDERAQDLRCLGLDGLVVQRQLELSHLAAADLGRVPMKPYEGGRLGAGHHRRTIQMERRSRFYWTIVRSSLVWDGSANTNTGADG
jgi:hypothetical protein